MDKQSLARVAALAAMVFLSFGLVCAATPAWAGDGIGGLSERFPPGQFKLVSDWDPDLSVQPFGHSRYQVTAPEGQAATGSWQEQLVGAHVALGKRVTVTSHCVGNDPYKGGQPLLRWCYIKAQIFKEKLVYLRVGQQPLPFGLDQTVYGPADCNMPVPLRPVDLATVVDKALALDAELVFLGKPAHSWLYVSQGRGPNKNDDNEPFRDYGWRGLVSANSRLDLGASLQVGKRLQTLTAGMPAGISLGDRNTYQRQLGVDVRYWPKGRDGKLRLEAEWLSRNLDIPWGRDRVHRQGYLRWIKQQRAGVEVVVQWRYDDPDDMNPQPGLGKERQAVSIGLNLGTLEERQRIQLAYELRKNEADQFTLVYQLRF